MKKLILSAFAIIPALAAQAQSPVDAMALSQTELRGSARFMSMGGAFTALGADLSVLGQNPAGIGMYRGSDIGLTLGIDINSDKAQYDGGSRSESNTLANINNAGYVGTYMLGDNNDYSISWGFSYNRLYRFNRTYMGNNIPMQSSVTNYFAGLTNGYNPNDLLDEAPNDPYNNWSQDAPDWMSVLLYNSGMINCETSIDDHGDLVLHDQYRGLWQWGGVDGLGNKVNPTSGFADFRITERGHADEYNISLGGSVMNLVYWGLGVGITDLDFTREYSYTEHSMERALIPAPTAGYELGDVKYANLYSRQHIWGTGANFKIGAIIKPINELRIGLAVHTPTYYSLSSSSYGDTRFFYSNGFSGEESTPYDDYSFQLNNPWKVMAGVAGVIGGRAIISVDYQYDAYGNMKLKYDDGNNMVANNDNIQRYYKGTNTVRAGMEYRITPQLSARLGCNFSSTASKSLIKDANTSAQQTSEISTAGQNPSFLAYNNTRYITAGLGYKVQGFYFDLAYVNKHSTAQFNAYTPFVDYDDAWAIAPTAKLTHNSSQIVASIGFRF